MKINPTSDGGSNPIPIPHIERLETVSYPLTPARPVQTVKVVTLRRLLAPIVTSLVANCECMIDPDPIESDSGGRSAEHWHLEYDLATLGHTVENLGRTAPLHALVRANHGKGPALRQPMKLTIETTFGGPGDTPAASARLIVSAPKQAELAACKAQAHRLLKYLLRSDWVFPLSGEYDQHLRATGWQDNLWNRWPGEEQ